VTRSAEHTALVLIDPYNDFLSEGGKLWPLVSEVAGKLQTLDNLKAATTAARAKGIRVFYTRTAVGRRVTMRAGGTPTPAS